MNIKFDNENQLRAIITYLFSMGYGSESCKIGGVGNLIGLSKKNGNFGILKIWDDKSFGTTTVNSKKARDQIAGEDTIDFNQLFNLPKFEKVEKDDKISFECPHCHKTVNVNK